jgi:hypothetical protein
MDCPIDVIAGIINYVGPRPQADPAHHFPVIKKRKQRLRIARVPSTQDQPLGLNLGLERIAHVAISASSVRAHGSIGKSCSAVTCSAPGVAIPFSGTWQHRFSTICRSMI